MIGMAALSNTVWAAEPDALPECKIALRILSSPAYIKDHQGEIPDAASMDETAKVNFVGELFRKTVSTAENQEQYCTNTIRETLSYSSAYHLPQACVEFLPLLKKSFEEKVSYKKDLPKFVKQKMDESLIDMLVLDETAPEKLVQRCEVGIKVMQVDLNDKHLKQKYPLPATCEALFLEMEKTLILPSELETLRRQRVIFAIENQDTPKNLEAICEDISR